MKDYGDERFIYRLAQERDKAADEPDDIRNGYAVIYDKRVEFSEREIIPNKLFMIIPSGFETMPLELAKIKYPNENRPNIIFMDERGATTINFTLRSEELEIEETQDMKDAIQQVIQKMNPSFSIINSSVVDALGTRIGYFDFVSPAIDDEVYNRMFILSLEGRLVMGSFNCLHVNMAGWLDILEQMLRFVRVC